MPIDVRNWFYSRPSRVIRILWGLVYNIEKKFRGILMWIGSVFEIVFRKRIEAAEKHKSTLGVDEVEIEIHRHRLTYIYIYTCIYKYRLTDIQI